MFKKKVHHLNFITVVQRHGTIIKTCDRAKSYFEHLKKVIKAEYAHRHLYTHTVTSKAAGHLWTACLQGLMGKQKPILHKSANNWSY